MKADFLIIGQGVSGSWLSYCLMIQGVSFRIVDSSQYFNASSVASGLINPITGRRYVKTWMADQLIEYADKHYPQMESLCNTKFYYKERILKYLLSNYDLNEWSTKAKTGYYHPFLNSDELVFLDQESFQLRNGCFQIDGGSRIDSRVFLRSWRSYLMSKGLLIEEHINSSSLEVSQDSVGWNGMSFGKVILCNGYSEAHGKYFGYLPFAVTKGECLHIKAPDLKLDSILSAGISIIPIGNDIYYVGSTTELNDFSLHPTSKMFNRLNEELKKIIKAPYEIKEHFVGIRPTVKDRRPLIGHHPKYQNLLIFNGMGTKGYSLAPFFADAFVNQLLSGATMDPEVSISRYQYLYENARAGYSV